MSDTKVKWYIAPIHKEDVRAAVMYNGEYGKHLATVNLDQEGISRKEQEANARLIVAAPDLLEACKEMLDRLSRWYPQHAAICKLTKNCPEKEAIDMAKAAIAKAKAKEG